VSQVIHRSAFVLSLVLVGLLVAPHAHAQGASGADKAAAEALFKQGKKAFDAGKHAQACGKFDASHKLDPAVGTLLFLGECNERQGKTASAWAAFTEAAALAGRRKDQKRKELAQVRVSALEPQVSKLMVMVSDPAPQLSIRRDGVVLPEPSWGEALPIDPGEHAVEASAPGKKVWMSSITVADGGETFTVNIPTLQDLNSGGPGPAPVPTPGPRPESGGDQGGGGSGSALRITGLTVAGLGVVGVVVGSVFGVLAKGSNDDSLEACRTETLCSPEGLALRDDAKTQATVSTATFIVGGVLLAGGLTLFFLAPDDEGSPEVALDATFGPGQTGLTLRGSF
jgi:hypothetical protein